MSDDVLTLPWRRAMDGRHGFNVEIDGQTFFWSMTFERLERFFGQLAPSASGVEQALAGQRFLAAFGSGPMNEILDFVYLGLTKPGDLTRARLADSVDFQWLAGFASKLSRWDATVTADAARHARFGGGRGN